MNSESKADTSVLVIGGGLGGLSAALFLAWRGVRTVLVEKHAGSSPHPRAIGFTTRTMEMLRAVGLGDRIPMVPMNAGRPRRVAAESLAGKWAEEVPWTPSLPQRSPNDAPPPADGYSPCTGAAIAQDKLEAVLREQAIELGVDIRMSTELVSFDQDALGVTVKLRRRDGGESTLRADYLIAADGHKSPIREALGIKRSGHGFMRVVRSVLFRAELEQYLEAGISQFELNQPGLSGMLTTYRDGRWLLMFQDDEERDEATLRSLVVRAVGRSDVPFEIVTTGRWVLSALIADRFSSGRMFLVGDSAHTLPPARGGYGANTGIEDAFNIAWKLASVISGESAPHLLDTYDAERRPIAWLRHGQIFARQDYAAVATDEEKKVTVIEDDAMELGQLYRSKAVLGADDRLPPALRPEQWAGQPGTRAHHIWASVGGEKASTIDLLQRNWTLVTEDVRWCEAITTAGKAMGIDVRCLLINGTGNGAATLVLPPMRGAGKLTLDTPFEQIVAEPGGKAALDAHLPEVRPHPAYETFKTMSLRQLQPVSRGIITKEKLAKIEPALAEVLCRPVPGDAPAFSKSVRIAFGIGPHGASLVRPDGYVAWRSVEIPANPAKAIVDALRQVAFAKAG